MSELYELPKGWEWKKLGDLAEYVNGMAFKPTDFSDTGYPIIRIQNLNGKTNYNYFNGEAKEKYYVKDGDILISWSASLDVYKWDGGDAILNQHIFNTNINLDTVNYDFFYHTIKYSLAEIMKNSHGVGMKHITKGKFENIDIPLPPLQEQKRIVSKLNTLFEKIDKSIALHQKNMDEANVFMGSVLNDIFGELEEQHKKVKLSTVIKIIGGGTPSKKEKSYWDNGSIKWATVGDMNVETITNTELSITEDGLKNSSSNIIPKEAIIIATRVGLGKVCYLNDDTAINQDLKGLLPLTDKLNIRFLFNYFKNIKKFIISNGTGATVKGVKLDFVKELLIPFPSQNIQQKTVAYLDEISQKIEKIKSVQKEKMESLIALKASILDQAFRGKL